MALGNLNLRVSKQDFVNRIELITQKMNALDDVIQKYGEARNNLDQFVEEGDSTYQQWIERIDANVTACRKARAALDESRQKLQTTVDQMEGVNSQIANLVQTGTEAAKSTVEAAIRVAPYL